MKKIVANDNVYLSKKEKEIRKKKIEKLFENFFEILGIDREKDHNTKETPKRISKMYIDELLDGCYSKPPKITTFPNSKKYDQMIVSGPLKVSSICSHHFVPFVGTCWIGMIPGDTVIGLSKFSRVVKYFMKRPQIQEELTQQISGYLENLMNPKGLIVVMKCQHMCMTIRGVEEPESWMYTSSVKGAFSKNIETRKEFFDLIGLKG